MNLQGILGVPYFKCPCTNVIWLFGSRLSAAVVCLAAMHTLTSWVFHHPIQGIFYAIDHVHYRSSFAHTTDAKQLQSLVCGCTACIMPPIQGLQACTCRLFCIHTVLAAIASAVHIISTGSRSVCHTLKVLVESAKAHCALLAVKAHAELLPRCNFCGGDHQDISSTVVLKRDAVCNQFYACL